MRPDWAEAHFLLGTALRLTGQRSAARTELARALEIDASLHQARQVLAEVHADLGEHEYAVEEGRRYLQQKPDASRRACASRRASCCSGGSTKRSRK